MYNNKDLDNVREKVLVSKPEGLKPLGLVMGVGGVVVAEFVNPASANAQDSNWPDCGYGKEAEWSSDLNGDGQPGPSKAEFYCKMSPGCGYLYPLGVVGRHYRADTSTEQEQLEDAEEVIWCRGNPLPEFKDFFDNNPWADELLIANSVVLDDFLLDDPYYENVYWAKRLRQLQSDLTTEDEPATEEPDSQTPVDEEQEPEPQAEPEEEVEEEPVVEPATEEPVSQAVVGEEQEPEPEVELEEEVEEEPVVEPATEEPVSQAVVGEEQEPEPEVELEEEVEEEPVVEPVTEETDSQTPVDEEQEPEPQAEPEEEVEEEPVVEPATEEPVSQAVVGEEQEPEPEVELEEEVEEEPVVEPATEEPVSQAVVGEEQEPEPEVELEEEVEEEPVVEPVTEETVPELVTESVSQVPESDTYVPEVIAIGSVSVLVIGVLSVYLKRKYKR